MAQKRFGSWRQTPSRALLLGLVLLTVHCGSTQEGAGKGNASPSAGAAGAASAGGGQAGGALGVAGSAGAALGTGGTNNPGGVAGGGGASAGSGAAGSSGQSGNANTAGQGGAAGVGGSASGGAGVGGVNAGGGAGCAELPAGPITTSAQHLDVGVHDPAMIWDGSRWVLFATGGTLGVRRSADMRTWTNAGDIFSKVPAWVTTTLGSTPKDLWAPDVSFFNCKFHIYYAGSTFGSRNSVIGLVTTPTLNPASPDYRFTDVGLIVRSLQSDNANAIDPNVSYDETGAPWLAWGSYGTGGIQLRKLDAATGKLSTSNPTTYSIADRNGSSIEAPSIVSHNGFYYLFVSLGACCADVNSTYTTAVGRASKISGPYTNKAGANMTDGASEQLLAKSGRYIGPGGGTAFRSGNSYLYAYHYYDGNDAGAHKLLVRPITWDANDWPVLGNPLFP